MAITGLLQLIYYCCTVNKYQPLIEEDFKELADISKNADAKESSQAKEIVLTES